MVTDKPESDSKQQNRYHREQIEGKSTDLQAYTVIYDQGHNEDVH